LVGKRRKGEKRKMNKRYLPLIAAILIAITCASIMPVLAQVVTLPTYIYAAPTLTVLTIPQDDGYRHTGVMWLADSETQYGLFLTPPAPPTWDGIQDLMSQFKILVSYNGVPVTPTSLYCQVVEKDKYNPIKNKQFPTENLYTVPVDVSTYFTCKFRWGKPGVGVIDVYYIGPGQPVAIADYILVVGANYAVGRSTVYGTDMQDICLLGWPSDAAVTPYVITKPDGTFHWIYSDPMEGWASCEDMALVQHADLGVPIPWS
jgi:hypothetical protein